MNIQKYIVPRNPSFFPGPIPNPHTLRRPLELSPGYVELPAKPYRPAAMGAVDTDAWERLGWGTIISSSALYGVMGYAIFHFLGDESDRALFWGVMFGALEFSRRTGARRENLRLMRGE
jgi:hypothetical protein